jgi:hypothetical protein
MALRFAIRTRVRRSWKSNSENRRQPQRQWGKRTRRTAMMWSKRNGERSGDTMSRLGRSGVTTAIPRTAFTLITQATRVRAHDPERGGGSSAQTLSRQSSIGTS